jgi:hypothetical protein
MKKVNVLKAGVSGNGNNWALLSDDSSAIIMIKAIVNTKKPLTEGETIELPEHIFNALKWEA